MMIMKCIIGFLAVKTVITQHFRVLVASSIVPYFSTLFFLFIFIFQKKLPKYDIAFGFYAKRTWANITSAMVCSCAEVVLMRKHHKGYTHILALYVGILYGKKTFFPLRMGKQTCRTHL